MCPGSSGQSRQPRPGVAAAVLPGSANGPRTRGLSVRRQDQKQDHLSRVSLKHPPPAPPRGTSRVLARQIHVEKRCVRRCHTGAAVGGQPPAPPASGSLRAIKRPR